MEKKRTIKRKSEEISISKPIVNSMLTPALPIGETLAGLTGFENKVLLGFIEAVYRLFQSGIMKQYDGYFENLASEKEAEYLAQEAARKSREPIPVKTATLSFFISANSFINYAFGTTHGINAEQKRRVFDTVLKLTKAEYVIPYRPSEHGEILPIVETLLIANISEKTHEGSMLRVSIGDGLLFGLWKTARGRNSYRISAETLRIAQNSNSKITCIAFAWIARNRYNLEKQGIMLSFKNCLETLKSEINVANYSNIRELRKRLNDEIERLCRRTFEDTTFKIDRKLLTITRL